MSQVRLCGADTGRPCVMTGRCQGRCVSHTGPQGLLAFRARFHSFRTMSGLTEYELLRQRRIEQNKARLQQIDPVGAAPLLVAAKRPHKQRKPSHTTPPLTAVLRARKAVAYAEATGDSCASDNSDSYQPSSTPSTDNAEGNMSKDGATDIKDEWMEHLEANVSWEGGRQ